MADDSNGEFRKAAEFAAGWWAEQLAGVPRFDNGDKSRMGGLTMLMALSARASMADPSDDTLAKFREALVTRLMEHSETEWPFAFGVGYGPDGILADAAEEAGLNAGEPRWPWKTMMWIRAGQVTVSAGYGAKHEHLYLSAYGAGRLRKDAEKRLRQWSNKEPGSVYWAERIAEFKADAEAQLAQWTKKEKLLLADEVPSPTK